MSALAQFCLKKNMFVSGSDSKRSKMLYKLKDLGVKISFKHSRKNITGQDLIVYSGAVSCDNVERIEAAKREIPQLERADFLALVSQCYKNVIAVSGTHGKTTTTAMLAHCFNCAGLNPCVHLGGESEQIGGNFLFNEGEFFITEACEYRKSFLTLSPNCSVVLNIEKDHLECYENEKDLKNTFKKFLRAGSDFRVCLNGIYRKNVVTFGNKEGSDFCVKNILSCFNRQTFDVYKKGEKIGNFSLNLIGDYNVLNALACITVCNLYGIETKIVQKALEEFKSVSRRFERVGEMEGCEVYKDYAHHPTEIDVLLNAINERYSDVVVIFQPHTYSRTKSCFEEFVNVFCKYKNMKIIFYPTYAARERRILGSESKDLFLSVSNAREGVYYCKNYRSIKRKIYENFNRKGLIVAVGAGDIERVCDYLIK